MAKKIDWYGEKDDYIHAKWGDLVKKYNFTEKFRAAHPVFCTEYENYWDGKPSQFKDPMQILNYCEYYNIPVHFYFNFTDTPAKNIAEVKEYLCRERYPSNFITFKDGKHFGWDGEEHKFEEDK